MADLHAFQPREPESPDLEGLARRYRDRTQDLRRLRSDLMAAAERESDEIVATAAADIRRVILKAHGDLSQLATQVRAAVADVERVAAVQLPPVPDPPAVIEDPRPLPCPWEVRGANLRARALERVPLLDAEIVMEIPDADADDQVFGVEAMPIETAGRGPRPFRTILLAVVAAGLAVVMGTGIWLSWTPPGGAAPGLADTEMTAPRQDPAAVVETAPIGLMGAAPSASADPAIDPAQTELAAAAERWLDAYYANDSVRLASFSPLNVSVTDARAVHERLPPGLLQVERILMPRVQVYGAAAILTARLSERPSTGAPEVVSFLSQTWTRRDGQWHLNDVRLVSAATLEEKFRTQN